MNLLFLFAEEVGVCSFGVFIIREYDLLLGWPRLLRLLKVKVYGLPGWRLLSMCIWVSLCRYVLLPVWVGLM